MKKISLISALCALFACLPVEAQQPASEAAKPVDLETMVQDSRCGQVLVTCLIGGQPMRMMLDTGATHTVLHAESAARIKNAQWLDTSNMKFRGNSSQRPQILISSLQVSESLSPQHPIMVVSLASVRSMLAEPVDGILGMDVLGQLPFTFDLRSGKLSWGVPEGMVLCPLYGTRDDNGRMFVQVSCMGHAMELLLDTGSSITRVYEKDWKPGVAGAVQARMGDIDTAAGVQVTQGKAADLELTPGVVVKKVEPVFCPENDRSMLGMDALRGAVLVHLPAPGMQYGSFFVAK